MQDIPEKVKKALEMTERLELFFDTADLGIKRKIIGSIFPENIVFDGKQHRTARVKELFQDIYQINSMITYNKISPKSKKSTLDRVVDPSVLISNRFVEDLGIILKLSDEINTKNNCL
ncbi:hypothetical protein GCM10011339_44030 [Echinicola rosea]|uniref:Uncharacterized protein n=2 Tax=Echinicola rosea TaxID=1807691 RepID=A0ABQ1VB27_9BACT|nr:hypothetical protein GCM10011339_44030 [Echinicola rosea]